MLMTSLIARVRAEIDDALADKGDDWIVRSVDVHIPVVNDVTEIEFLAELDDLLKKYGKTARVSVVPEVEIDGKWLTEQELRDLEADYYLSLMKDMDVE